MQTNVFQGDGRLETGVRAIVFQGDGRLETGVRTIVLQGEMKLKYTTLQMLLRTVEIQGRNGTVWI